MEFDAKIIVRLPKKEKERALNVVRDSKNVFLENKFENVSHLARVALLKQLKLEEVAIKNYNKTIGGLHG